MLAQLAQLWCAGLLAVASAQDSPGTRCEESYRTGSDNFMVDVSASVREGAAYLGSPDAQSVSACLGACCRSARCNLAVTQSTAGEHRACYLFDCLYRRKYVCSFAEKDGFRTYLTLDVLENILQVKSKSPKIEDRPPIADAGQDRLVQPSSAVYLNGIQSQDDRGIVSYKWTQVKGDHPVVMEKTEHKDQVKVSNLTSGDYVFQLVVTDGSGQSDSDQVTVQVLTPEKTSEYCLAPGKVGPCRGSFPRWHYNATSMGCEPFTFGGCRENFNNYISQWECNSTCEGVWGPPSTRGIPLPKNKEVCGAPCGTEHFPCANGCCLDSALDCDGVSHCSDGSDEEDCYSLNTTFSHLLAIPVNEQKAICTEPPKTGPCRASFPRYFYNPLKRKCLSFTYGGCGGNRNNFETESSCLESCGAVTEEDVFLKAERADKESNSGTTVIGLLLGVGVAVLLIAVGYWLMKRRKKDEHRRVPLSAPAPAKESEHLVYNSTTKPL